MNFPPFPRNSRDIYDYPGHGEYMACTIVHNCTVRQLMAFRKLRIALGEQSFRESLVEAIDILARSTTIHTPPGWLYDYIRKEVPHA